MYLFISILIMLAALALVFIVIVQNSKGGGLASGFASTNNIMGVRKTTDVLEKSTWWLASIVMFLCVVSTMFISNPNVDEKNIDKNIIKTEQKNAVKPVSTPNFGEQQGVNPVANTPNQTEETPSENK